MVKSTGSFMPLLGPVAAPSPMGVPAWHGSGKSLVTGSLHPAFALGYTGRLNFACMARSAGAAAGRFRYCPDVSI